MVGRLKELYSAGGIRLVASAGFAALGRRFSRARRTAFGLRKPPFIPAQDLEWILDYSENAPLLGPGRDRQARCLDLHWIIPDFKVGAGGHMTIFRMVQFLERFGHKNTLWIHGRTQFGSGQRARDVIRSHFVPIQAEVRLLGDGEIIGDAVIATDRWTTFPARRVSRVRERFYFVQDYEPLFYPAGTHSLLTESTYSFGFTCITGGKWLQELMQRRYGCRTFSFDLAYDPGVYSLDSSAAREQKSIAFYYRPFTPRRAFELGVLAFRMLARKGLDFRVEYFGAPIGRIETEYEYRDHGVLSDTQLADLYRRSTLGVVFSATNYSLVPNEMMACGLPVVDLDGENTRAVFPSGTVALGKPTPWDIARQLELLLKDETSRNAYSEKGLAHVSTLSWEKSAKDVEKALLIATESL